MARFTSYLPNRDADLLDWSLAASALITATPTAFGLTALIATGFSTATTDFQTSLAACAKGVRNAAAVTTKNEKKQALKENIRAWVAIVDGTATVTDAQRQELGLTVRSGPTPVPPPATEPVLQVKQVNGRTVTIRLRQQLTGSLRGKPGNSVGAIIYSFVGAAPPVGTDGWKVEGQTGKTVFNVSFDGSLAPGTTVWLTAQWIGTRLETGPASAPVGVTFGAAGAFTVAA